MIIKVNGKQIDIGDALREHVENNLLEGVQKYAERPVDATVTFSKDRHEFKCDCAVHLSTGLQAQASGRAGDVYAAFEQACERLEKQLRRYKRRLKDHHKDRTDPIQMMDAASFVIDSGDEASEEPETLQPVIIAETRTTIPHLSVGEAVMQMEMGGQAVLMFHNDRTESLNVVYRRDDGNIGWIDPTPMSKAS